MPAPRLVVVLVVLAGCGGWGSGSRWVKEPLTSDEEHGASGGAYPETRSGATRAPASRTLGRRGEESAVAAGRVLGTFRNTYYDFPSEADASLAGGRVRLMDASCALLAEVPRSFHDAVCVQGSGALRRGDTVSFARRDCPCAEVCPRTGQRICFEALDRRAFPFGRGAAGRPITPMRTVAADTDVLPMGTVVYIPELEGLLLDDAPAATDGCFVVEDRGSRVRGEHVDVFTGHPRTTARVNAEVPSNRGVTVVEGGARCAHLGPAK